MRLQRCNAGHTTCAVSGICTCSAAAQAGMVQSVDHRVDHRRRGANGAQLTHASHGVAAGAVFDVDCRSCQCIRRQVFAHIRDTVTAAFGGLSERYADSGAADAACNVPTMTQGLNDNRPIQPAGERPTDELRRSPGRVSTCSPVALRRASPGFV